MAYVVSEFIAGDTYKVQFDHPDHLLSDGWALSSYKLKGAATHSLTVSVVDGKNQAFKAANDTLTWPPGAYWAFATFSKDSESYTKKMGVVNVSPSLDAAGGYDGRSIYERHIEAIDKVMAGKLDADVQSYVIGNRQLVKIDPTKLIELRRYYVGLLNQEKRKRAKAAGRNVDIVKLVPSDAF